jgi:hypothetical protein
MKSNEISRKVFEMLYQCLFSWYPHCPTTSRLYLVMKYLGKSLLVMDSRSFCKVLKCFDMISEQVTNGRLRSFIIVIISLIGCSAILGKIVWFDQGRGRSVN